MAASFDNVENVKELEEFTKAFEKIERKDPVLAERIKKKLNEIINRPEHYKSLRNVLAGHWRVQFGHYILKYKLEGNTIILISITHHDQAY